MPKDTSPQDSNPRPKSLPRRDFLKQAGFLGLAALGLETTCRAANLGRRPRPQPGTGPQVRLVPSRDLSTGKVHLHLPEGFRYRSFGWTGEPLTHGGRTPAQHDGMGAFSEGRNIVLLRNHEVTRFGGALKEAQAIYDPRGSGGVSRLVFDPVRETLVESEMALSGTLVNCSGGPTPWGSWLTCEETLATGPRTAKGRLPHGFVYEVPVSGKAQATPLLEMGRFFHEAVAIDPKRSDAYLTEDRMTSSLYRFVPHDPDSYAKGGQLFAMALAEKPRCKTTSELTLGEPHPVHWVTISDPTRAHSPEDPGDCLGVFQQGQALGAAIFARLEGIAYCNGSMVFSATAGGPGMCGQIYRLDLEARTLTLIFESPGHGVVSMPDNLTATPQGSFVLCEDGAMGKSRLHILTKAGTSFPFAVNHLKLDGDLFGHRGSFTSSEFAGACFDPEGKWLFVNVQKPGVTYAITGPWESLPA